VPVSSCAKMTCDGTKRSSPSTSIPSSRVHSLTKSQAVRDLVRAIDVILDGGTFFGGPQKAEANRNDKPNPGAVFCQDFAFAL